MSEALNRVTPVRKVNYITNQQGACNQNVQTHTSSFGRSNIRATSGVGRFKKDSKVGRKSLYMG